MAQCRYKWHQWLSQTGEDQVKEQFVDSDVLSGSIVSSCIVIIIVLLEHTWSVSFICLTKVTMITPKDVASRSLDIV